MEVEQCKKKKKKEEEEEVSSMGCQLSTEEGISSYLYNT